MVVLLLQVRLRDQVSTTYVVFDPSGDAELRAESTMLVQSATTLTLSALATTLTATSQTAMTLSSTALTVNAVGHTFGVATTPDDAATPATVSVVSGESSSGTGGFVLVSGGPATADSVTAGSVDIDGGPAPAASGVGGAVSIIGGTSTT